MIGTDFIVTGGTVRAITNRKPSHLSRPVQKLFPLEFRSEAVRNTDTAFVIGTHKYPRERSLLEM